MRTSDDDPQPELIETVLVSTAELSRRTGVVVRTLQNYVGDGMPVAKRTKGGHARFDPDACARWIAAHKHRSVRGGKRENAGRKPAGAWRDGSPDRPERPSASTALAAERLEAIAARDGPPADAMHIADLLLLSRDELEWFARHGHRLTCGASLGAVTTTLEKLVGLKTRDLQLRRELGEVIDAAEARARYGERLAAARAALERIPRRLRERYADRLPDGLAQHLELDAAELIRDALLAATEPAAGDAPP